jgi:hypothetical protein
MAQCVAVVQNLGVQLLAIDPTTPIESCSYVLFNAADYTTLSGFNQLAFDYFRFDPELFAYIVGANLVLSITGYEIGKVLKYMK